MPHQKAPCPDCGRPKGIESERCGRCAGLARRTAPHGTESRYRRHLRDGERPVDCEPCKRAHAEDVAKNQRRQRAARRRARAQARAAKRTCPRCGSTKTPTAQTCRKCVDRRQRKSRAEHGTDSGYYRHIRQAGEPSDDWPRAACAECLAAHRKATKEREVGKPPRARTRSSRPKSRRACRDCGKPVSERALRCRRCARLHHIEQSNELPARWRRVGLIWKAA